MPHPYHQPSPSLRPFVRTILVLTAAAETGSALPLFTNGMPALFCHTKKNNEGHENIIQLSLFGKSAPENCWIPNEHETIIAYFFNPFSLGCLFNISATRLLENPIELNSWSPHKTNALKTQLLYAATVADKINILDNLLLHQLEQNNHACEIIRAATDYIMYNPGTETFSALQQQLNLTERTFQRLFKKYVGITPNQYRRICQFQDTFSQLRNGEFDTLSDIAYDNGFADQSHFIRSFKEFAKTTPASYLRNGLNNENNSSA